jgi:broad specificity phosphatase PhoE
VSAVYLIRHGQASFGSADYDNLSDLGQEQARLLGQALRARLPAVHAAVTGTMTRQKQTARGCLDAMGSGAVVSEDAGFDEFDHDDLIARFRPRYANRLVLGAELAASLRPRQAFQEMFVEATARWTSGQYDHEYLETWPQFRARCSGALERFAGSLGSSRTALVFTSAGTITAVCQSLLAMPNEHAFRLNWTLVNCAVTKILVGSKGLHLSSLNEHGHFEADVKRLVTYR